mmetsp:Transcript_18973/g.47894  ORF Transcript_18973/g.47894 Transcript_18973/m.47894 type:complete len:210 (+) Transcript_18973:636-1265(+)
MLEGGKGPGHVGELVGGELVALGEALVDEGFDQLVLERHVGLAERPEEHREVPGCKPVNDAYCPLLKHLEELLLLPQPEPGDAPHDVREVGLVEVLRRLHEAVEERLAETLARLGVQQRERGEHVGHLLGSEIPHGERRPAREPLDERVAGWDSEGRERLERLADALRAKVVDRVQNPALFWPIVPDGRLERRHAGQPGRPRYCPEPAG